MSGNVRQLEPHLVLLNTTLIKPEYVVNYQKSKISTKMTKKINKILERNILFCLRFSC